MSARKRKPKPNDKEQSERFVKKAKEIESGNAEKQFEEVIEKIAMQKKKCQD